MHTRGAATEEFEDGHFNGAVAWFGAIILSNKSDGKCCLLPPFDRVGIILLEQLSRTWINLEECIMASHNAFITTFIAEMNHQNLRQTHCHFLHNRYQRSSKATKTNNLQMWTTSTHTLRLRPKSANKSLLIGNYQLQNLTNHNFHHHHHENRSNHRLNSPGGGEEPVAILFLTILCGQITAASTNSGRRSRFQVKAKVARATRRWVPVCFFFGFRHSLFCARAFQFFT